MDAANQIAAQEAAEDQAGAARERGQLQCAVDGLSIDQCRSEIEQNARRAERDERNLEAQRSVAVWTRAMGVATLIAMTVGIFGLGLIFVTFRETRRAANEGLRANEIAKAQQRARIVVKAELGRFVTATQQSLVVSGKNAGASIALNCRATMGLFSEPPSQPTDFDEMAIPRPIEQGETEQFALWATFDPSVFVAGAVTYDTIFEKGCVSYFCFKFEFSNVSRDWRPIECRPSTWPDDR